MKRPTKTTTHTLKAECQACNWRSEAGNALGTAAQHHDTYGHQVITRIDREITYGDPHETNGQTTIHDALAEPTEPTATIPPSP